MEAIDMSKFMKNSKGHLVPIEHIKPIDLHRDQVVRELICEWKKVQDILAGLKKKAMGEIQAFIEMSLEQHNKIVGGSKGNVTLHTYDTSMKLQVATHDQISLTEEIHAALNLLYECANEWTDDGPSELKVIINDILMVGKNNKVCIADVFRLLRYNIDHPKWEPAMKAIRNSIIVVGSKSYVRAYERDEQGEYNMISLNMTRL